MGEEEERVRKLDEQSVRRPASQSQLFNPRQGSQGRAGGRASGKSARPWLPNTQTQSCMSCVYVLSILRHWPIFGAHRNTPHLPSLPRWKSFQFVSFSPASLCSENIFFFFSKGRKRRRRFWFLFAEKRPNIMHLFNNRKFSKTK